MIGPYNYDLIVIGGGSAGSTAASAVVRSGKKVLLIEKEALGGTCTNFGCVPSKSFLHAADMLQSIRNAKDYGLIKEVPEYEFQPVRYHKNRIVQSMHDSGRKVVENMGIELKKGTASIKDQNTVMLDGKEFTSEYILIATGSATFVPPIDGLENVPYMTSRNALDMEELPESIVIVGGSYIGLEFASFFNELGVRTTVVENSDRIASHEDEEISHELSHSLADKGIELIMGAQVLSVAKADRVISVRAKRGQDQILLSAASLLVATGRIPQLENLKLSDVGIKYGKKGIEVNDNLQTSVPNIYAAGDCIPSLQLEHVGVYEGWLAAQNILSGNKHKADYRVVPRVMFSLPEVGSVGETEQQARQHADVATKTFPYNSIPMAQISEDPDGLIKLVADANNGTLLGAHIMGAGASNLIHLAALAMQFNLPVGDIGDAISTYPTLAQGFYHACESLAMEIEELSTGKAA